MATTLVEEIGLKHFEAYNKPWLAHQVWADYISDVTRFGLEDKAFGIMIQADTVEALDVELYQLVSCYDRGRAPDVHHGPASEDDDVHTPSAGLTPSNILAREHEDRDVVSMTPSARKSPILRTAYGRKNRMDYCQC